MTGTDVPEFKKSSFSPTDNCVEVALLPSGGAFVRDTKNRSGGTLQIAPDAWRGFLADAAAGACPWA